MEKTNVSSNLPNPLPKKEKIKYNEHVIWWLLFAYATYRRDGHIQCFQMLIKKLYFYPLVCFQDTILWSFKEPVEFLSIMPYL